jgi:hypothetical protein
MLLSSILHSPWSIPNIYSDIGSFWFRTWVSGGVLANSSPTAFFEYPPISGLVLYASQTFGSSIGSVTGSNYNGYFIVFSALSLGASGVIAWSAFRLARRLNVTLNPLYFLLPSIIVYGVYNFDLFNAMFIILSIQMFVEDRKDLSAVFIGLAIATKLVAGVILPVFLLELNGTRSRIIFFLLAVVFAGIPFIQVVLNYPGFFAQFYNYFGNWGLEDAWYIWIFGDPFSRAAKAFGIVLLGILLFRVYTLKVPVVRKTFLALCAYLLATPIYAPQFNVMLIPLVAVLAISSPALYSWEIFNVLIILTWFSVPTSATSGPTYAWTVPQTASLLRSASLALLGLSVASGSGHSLKNWILIKTGLGSVQEKLPVGPVSGG